MAYMLAVEPDQGQAAVLRNAVAAQLGTTLTVVDSMDAAIAAIGDEVPSLIFLSPLLPPREEHELLTHLRNLDEAACPQILVTPWMSAPGDEPSRSWSTPFKRPRWRPARCEPSVFADQIAVYLDQIPKTLGLRASWSQRKNRLHPKPSVKPHPESAHLFSTAERARADRRSAVRFEELHGAKVLIDGAAANLVDLSATGAQVWSPALLPLGGRVQLWLSMEEEAIRCEAGIVWGTFDVVLPTQTPGYRAGVDFNSADRRAIERLYFGLNWKRSAVETPATRVMLLNEPWAQTSSEFMVTMGQRERRAINQNLDSTRHRAERQMGADVPWLSSIKLPWGLEVRLLNLSSTGMLIETGSKFTPGSDTHLRLCGPETDLVISACFVRSEVAAVDRRGVTYHAAVSFKKQLDLDELARTGSRCVHCGHHAHVV
jgi:pimeloyl-ACP methyl ester carboxylesterase